MTRLVLIEALLFLLPFFFYGAYLLLRGRGNMLPQEMRNGPLGWLILAGFALMALGFASVAIFSGEKPGAVYRPTHYQGGKLVPGGFERPQEEQTR